MADQDDALVHIDGRGYTLDDLTFREQREVRKLARELVDDPAAELVAMDLMDVVPIVVFVLRRREDASYTLEQALDLKWADLTAQENGNGKKRPTRRRAASA